MNKTRYMEEVVIHRRSHNYQDMYKIFIFPINFIKKELDISAYMTILNSFQYLLTRIAEITMATLPFQSLFHP